MIIKKNKCINFSHKNNTSVHKSVDYNRPDMARYQGENSRYGNRWECGHQSLDKRFHKVSKKYRRVGDSVSDV